MRLAWRWTPEDNLALCLPLFHMHGLGVGLHGTLVTGARATLIPRFTPEAVATAVSDGGATLLFGVPTMYHKLVASPAASELPGCDWRSAGRRRCRPRCTTRCAAACRQVVLERYGMTETVMLVSNPYEGERRAGTVGFPLPGVEVRLAAGGTAGPRRSRCAGPTSSPGTWTTPTPTRRRTHRTAGSGPATSARSTPTGTCASAGGPRS